MKDGHPENTTFGSIIAKDCAMILENAEVKTIISQNLNIETEEDLELKADYETLQSKILDGVIGDIAFNKKSLKMDIGVGVHTYIVEVKFDNILYGWNKSKAIKK